MHIDMYSYSIKQTLNTSHLHLRQNPVPDLQIHAVGWTRQASRVGIDDTAGNQVAVLGVEVGVDRKPACVS